MAQIGYGYGSEFQLMRFLGHHRNLLEETIRKSIGINDGNFYWFDFDFADREQMISGDSEMCGLSFLKKKIPEISRVCDEVKEYAWNFDRWQYWDAVFLLKGVIYFVEAKANLEEAEQKCTAKSTDSIKTIINAFEETCGNRKQDQRKRPNSADKGLKIEQVIAYNIGVPEIISDINQSDCTCSK